MTDNEKNMSEQESLQLIADMIQKAKGSFHDSGTSAILWGSVIGLAGLISFVQSYFKFSIGFDIWWLIFAAIIPQVIISINETRQRKVTGHDTTMVNAIWTVYGISVFALLFYVNVVPGVSDAFFANEGKELTIKNLQTGTVENFKLFIPGQVSLYLILFAIPTLATGIGRKFKPMLLGGIACYIFFVVSCYTAITWDTLLMSLAGIFNWLIPGLILRNRYLKGKGC
ncbi:MAG: hypothetical protein V4722_24865 [Bacteroidota bacterium]